MIRLAPLFELTLQLGTLVSLGQLAVGERRVAAIDGGRLSGPELEGEVLSGSDCQLMRSDGVLEIDASYLVRLSGGEHLRILNQGFRHGPPEVLARLARGEAVPPDAYFFRTVLRFESGAPALAWLNRTIAVAQAERQGASVVLRAAQLL